MEQRGIGRRAEPEEADTLQRDEPLLAELYSASILGRVATGPRAGRRIARAGDGFDLENAAMKSGRCCASIKGFSVHAGVCVPARDRIRLERLLRYAARPPLSTERLSLLPDGRLLYRLKRRWSNGTTHVIYEPMELMERLAALVPPPRFNITRFYGVLAPAATFRPFIVPEDKTAIAPTHPCCPARIDTSKTDAIRTQSNRGKQPKNHSWAQLMMRVFELDVLACPRCGGRIQAVSYLDGVILTILIAGLLYVTRQFLADMIDGTPFTSANARRLMWIGWILLGMQIAKPIAEGLAAGWILSMVKVQSPSLSPGGYLNWSGILVALFILILSAIFRRGVELEKEHSLTV